MKSFSTSDAKNRFGQLIDMAQAEPVRVQRQGRDVAIVMSPAEFRHLAKAGPRTAATRFLPCEAGGPKDDYEVVEGVLISKERAKHRLAQSFVASESIRQNARVFRPRTPKNLSTPSKPDRQSPSTEPEKAAMDWSAAIETNREALRRILTTLVVMAGLRGRFAPQAQDCPADATTKGGEDRDAAAGSGDPAEMRCEVRPTLPRHLHRAVLRLLRPAEAAARRLIIVMARDLPYPALQGQGPSLEERTHAATPASPKAREAARRVALPLFDPLPRWRGPSRPVAAGVPRISFPGDGASVPLSPRQPPMSDDPIDATRLALRLRAVAAALDDLPAHASRFARWRARRDAARQDNVQRKPSPRRGITRRVWPLRPGRPPGWRREGRHAHPVHDVLTVVHDLAFWAMERADTS